MPAGCRVAEAPPEQEVRIDGQECVAHGWFAPRCALDRSARGEMLLVLPTVRHLELLAGMAGVQAALEWARGHTVEVVEPRIVGSGEQARVEVPDDPRPS